MIKVFINGLSGKMGSSIIDIVIKQNDIEVGQWLNLHFGGDFPAIFTTQVTSIEEDMIELTKYPDLEVIYIDFEYKGIPEKLPIESIIITRAIKNTKRRANLKKKTSLLNSNLSLLIE